jgi:hypothetical protein
MSKSKRISATNAFFSCLVAVLASVLSGCDTATPESLRQSYLKLLHDHYKETTMPLDASGVEIALSVSVDKADRARGFDSTYGNFLPSYTQAVMDLTSEKLLPNATSINRFDAGVEDPALADKIGYSDILVEITETVDKAHVGFSLERTLTVRVKDIKGGGDIASATYADPISEFSIFTDDYATVFGKISSALNGRRLRDLVSHPDPSNIEGLLVVENVARSRALEVNQALVAAKTLVLPNLLQNDKTSELLNLEVKMEQAIVLLEHKAELSKEHAEAAVVDGHSPDESREFALIYQERVAILKPMLGAVKGEIENRQK